MTAAMQYVDLLEPRPEDVSLHAIALGLEERRFNNQLVAPGQTIADHQLLTARIALAIDAPDDVVIAMLLHDAPEGILCDVPGPLKSWLVVQLRDGSTIPWAKLEQRWLDAICRSLFPEEMAIRIARLVETSDLVHEIDRMALRVEALTMMPGAEDWAAEELIDTSEGPVRVKPIDPRAWPCMIKRPEAFPWRIVVSELGRFAHGKPCFLGQVGGLRNVLRKGLLG